MTDFNFLRIKWPKLAAIAADASRLVEVSPSSAVSTMQNFCEWATDIALDLYSVRVQNGITQQEKMDLLGSTGNVPTEIVTRMNNILMAGGHRVYHVHEDVEEARRCIDDVYEIARWLNREADRAGWPPRGGNVYRPPVSSGAGSSAADSRLFPGEIRRPAAPYLKLAGLGVFAVAAVVLLIVGIIKIAGRGGDQDVVTLSSSPSATSSSVLIIPTDTPTPAPEVEVYLDTINASDAPNKGFYKAAWKDDKALTIADKAYEHGIGWFIPSSSIAESSASASVKYALDGKYDLLRFDLGVDANMDYGDGYGTFRITIYADDEEVYDSDKQEYDYTEYGTEVDLKGCDTMKIVLTEKKGSKGTINVVLGDMRLVQGGAGSGDDQSTDEPADTATDESASPDPDATSKATSTKASASPKSGDEDSTTVTDGSNQEDEGATDPPEDEQENPPG